MICGVVATRDPRQVPARVALAQRQGAELVELRLDLCDEPSAALRGMAGAPLPWIATCRPARERGGFTGPEPARLELLRQAAAHGARYVDIERGCEAEAGIAPERLLISYHDWERTPDNLPALVRDLSDRGAALVKIATRAHSYDDCRRLLELPARSQTPLAAIAMGARGAITRIAYRKFGGALGYASLDPDEATADGQVGLAALVSDYRATEVGRTTRLFGLAGGSIGASLSPRLHNAAYHALGLDCRYLPFQCDELEDVVSCWRAAPEWDLGGLSVTMPHKESARDLADSLDAAAPDEPAVNTLVARGAHLVGHNTDGPGALAALRAALDDSWPRGRTVLLLGAGGAARTVGASFARAGAVLAIAARRADEATRLARIIGARVLDWAHRADDASELVVNATPVGSAPDFGSTPLPAGCLSRHMAVQELVYVPRRTRLIDDAERAGCRTVLGGEMFLHQAAQQLALMTGQKAPLELWRGLL